VEHCNRAAADRAVGTLLSFTGLVAAMRPQPADAMFKEYVARFIAKG